MFQHRPNKIPEFAGLEIAGLEFDGQSRRVENSGPENDGLERAPSNWLCYMAVTFYIEFAH